VILSSLDTPVNAPFDTAAILARFPSIRALVVGDVCLDRWCRYDPSLSEPSRETGIPRNAVVETEFTPGAAGTVAANLAALGAGRVSVLGAVGDDGFGWELERALTARGISTEFLIRSTDISTFTYTKLINASSGIEDLPRLDIINALSLPSRVESQLIDSLRKNARDFDVILVSDQAETPEGGTITAAMREELANLERLTWVDSRARLELFRNVVLKSNRGEIDGACGRICGNFADLLRRANSTLLMVTLGPEGVLVVDRDGETHVPARAVKNPVDICGAGDSFSAGAALALAIGASPVEAAQFGNLVASVTIMKPGTGTASPQELLAASGPPQTNR
jgi:rfaE bifunctional protein kinase chain/domain